DLFCPKPCTYACNDLCVRSCPDSKAILFPPPVVVTMPGPVLSTCPQESVVASCVPVKKCCPPWSCLDNKGSAGL
ncbi:KRFD protein, partial [Nyctibius bracteatus]|nr:KRFD protein [Nyctibius bracteatus]